MLKNQMVICTYVKPVSITWRSALGRKMSLQFIVFQLNQIGGIQSGLRARTYGYLKGDVNRLGFRTWSWFPSAGNSRYEVTSWSEARGAVE